MQGIEYYLKFEKIFNENEITVLGQGKVRKTRIILSIYNYLSNYLYIDTFFICNIGTQCR